MTWMSAYLAFFLNHDKFSEPAIQALEVIVGCRRKETSQSSANGLRRISAFASKEIGLLIPTTIAGKRQRLQNLQAYKD